MVALRSDVADVLWFCDFEGVGTVRCELFSSSFLRLIFFLPLSCSFVVVLLSYQSLPRPNSSPDCVCDTHQEEKRELVEAANAPQCVRLSLHAVK